MSVNEWLGFILFVIVAGSVTWFGGRYVLRRLWRGLLVAIASVSAAWRG